MHRRFLTGIAFSANECQSIHRLRTLNIHGHEACIRARPAISQQQVQMLTVNILQLKAGTSKKLEERIKAEMLQPSSAPPTLQRRRLALRKPPTWRKGRCWPPAYVDSRASCKTAFDVSHNENRKEYYGPQDTNDGQPQSLNYHTHLRKKL